MTNNNNNSITHNNTIKNINSLKNLNLFVSSNKRVSYTSSNNELTTKRKNEVEKEEKIRGHFLLKKNKFIHKGYIKHLTISETNDNTSKKKTKTIKDGFGKIKWTDNYRLYGVFSNNKINGFAIFISPQNKTVFKGEYEKNKPKGYGIFQNKNGYSIEGTWIKNKINGIGIEKWGDGSFYIGEYYKNKKEGIGFYQWKDGTTYEGEFDNDFMNGYGILKYSNNKKYEGQFENGVMNGYGEFSWGSRKKFIGNYVQGYKEGFGIYIWDIVIFEAYLGFWKNGKMNGLGVKIKDDIVRYGSWKDGIKEFWLKDSEELVTFYQLGKRNKKNNELSIYHTNIIRKSITTLDFANNANYIELMVQPVEKIKKFIFETYYNDKKYLRFQNIEVGNDS